MELKEGYKQTEVGVIPEDWEPNTLEDIIVNIIGGGTPRTDRPEFWGGRIPWATVKDFSTFSPFSTQEYVTELGVKFSATHIIPAGTFILATRIAIGRGTIYCVDVAINQDLKAIIFKKFIDILFIFYWFQINERLLQELGSGSTVKGISLDQLKKVHIAIPPFIEQKAIASALSDVDALLSSLDALITKKRDIKTAAMQELLTGKKRLPGFSGEWREDTIKNIAPLQRGYDLPLAKLKKGEYPVIGSNGTIFHHNEFKIKGPGVITGRSGTIGSVFFIEEDYWPHNTTLYVTNFYNNYPKFIYYLYNFCGFEQYSNGSGVPTLNRNDIHDIKIHIPRYAEQAAIAAILSDMDAEIAALESRRAKTLALKQGMMQELLTGRTRLLPEGD